MRGAIHAQLPADVVADCAMSKDHLLAKIVLSEARAGNLLPLMARISSGRLTAPEREFIVDFLERREGKRTKAGITPG